MSPPAVPVIAVDGPSGTGKGTLCLNLARHLGWHLLDSGALYRILAAVVLQEGLDPARENIIADRAASLTPEFRWGHGTGDEVQVWMDDHDFSAAIRTEKCGLAASGIAALPGVRAALLDLQQGFRISPGLVADGRDMGTVVFPDADLKIFLTASPEERARRRHKQLIGKGISVNLAQLSQGIADRDRRDSERSVSPLKPATDAVVIDATQLGIDEVTRHTLALLENHGYAGGNT